MRRILYPFFFIVSVVAAAILLTPILAGPTIGSPPPPERVPVRYRPTGRHVRYVDTLHASGAAATALGRDWLAAADAALEDPLPVEVPYRETGWLDPSGAEAIGYRFTVPRGQRVEIDVDLEADGPERLFVDLYRLPASDLDHRVHVASAAGEERRLELMVVDDSTYVLRLQPELLRGGRYTVTFRTLAGLRFPVAGHDSRAVQSRFGVPREGGRRRHRGVDIFAPRGTPVIAGADAVAVWVGESGRGGKVVWLELDGGHNLYYAHLDDHAVREDDRVRAGDVLGWVGNTGNARTTPPHLHFGVYLDVRDAVDPYPFIHQVDSRPGDVLAETAVSLGTWARTTADELDLRSAPGRGSAALSVLGRDVPLHLEGATGDHYRVRLPDDTVGYVTAAAVVPLEDAVDRTVTGQEASVRTRPVASAPVVDRLAPGTELPVLGRFGDWSWVSTPTGRSGWLSSPDLD